MKNEKLTLILSQPWNKVLISKALGWITFLLSFLAATSSFGQSITSLPFEKGIIRSQQKIYKREYVIQVETEITNVDSIEMERQVWADEVTKINTEGYMEESKSMSKEGAVMALTYNTYESDSLLLDNRWILQKDSKRVFYDTEYFYDKSNRVKLWKTYCNSRLSTKTKNYYDNNGLLIKSKKKVIADPRIRSLSESIEIRYQYDDQQRRSKQNVLRKIQGKKTTEIYETIYSSDGLKKSTFKYTLASGKKWLHDEILCDEKGRLMESVYYVSNPTTSKVMYDGIPYLQGDNRRVIFIYGESGLVTEDRIYKNGVLVQVKKYQYQYAHK